MKQLPPQHWQHDGQTFSVSLIVEGSTIVRMTQVTTAGGVIVPPTQYLGDHIANGLSKLGIESCVGCDQRIEWLNGKHRSAKRIGQRVKKLVARG